MTSLQAKLNQNLAKRLGKNMGTLQQGFTLVELLVVVVIVGILSAVALPQFFTQTKKAAATEGTQQASSIAKQASAYYLENGGIASGDTHTNCTAYAGTIKVDNTNFTYKCEGSKTAFKVIVTGKTDNDNTKDVVVTLETLLMEPSRSLL